MQNEDRQVEANNPALPCYLTRNRLVDTLKCRDNTNARSRWPCRCVGSPRVRPRSLRRCKTIWSLLSLRGIDRSGSHRQKRHSPLPCRHICPENNRDPGGYTPPSAASLAFVSFFPPTAVILDEAARRNALSPMAMVQFRGLREGLLARL